MYFVSITDLTKCEKNVFACNLKFFLAFVFTYFCRRQYSCRARQILPLKTNEKKHHQKQHTLRPKFSFQYYQSAQNQPKSHILFHKNTDYGRPERKLPSLHGRKFTPTPKFLGMAAAYFVYHIGPFFQISLIYAFIGCPQSVQATI